MGLPSSTELNQRFIPSKQLLPGSVINGILDAFNSYQTVTATPAGTQATSILINAANVNITVVATAADGIRVPPAKVGMEISIVNSDAADAAQIFASGSDTINATAGAIGVSLAAGAAIILRCIKDGNWRRFVSA